MANDAIMNPYNTTRYEDDFFTTSHIISSSTNDTLQSADDDYYHDVPVLGLGTPMFDVLYVTAFVTMGSSIAVSILLLIYICNFRPPNTGKVSAESRQNRIAGTNRIAEKGNWSLKKITEINPNNKVRCSRLFSISTWSFWKWNISERIIVYLAISDACLGTTNLWGSGWIYHAEEFPPDHACRTFAFVIEVFAFSQWVIILFAAVRAGLLVVRGYKLKTGVYDWRLLIASYLGPVILGAVAAGTHLLGRSGGWCFIELYTPRGRIFNQVCNFVVILVFLLLAISYGAIWWKIKNTEEHKNKTGGGGAGGENVQKYGSSVKIMMIFVFVFLLQWSSFIVFNFWDIFIEPPLEVRVVATFFGELGGVFNVIAYTIIRKKLQSAGAKKNNENGEATEEGTQKKKEGGAYISTANETVKTVDGPFVSKLMVSSNS